MLPSYLAVTSTRATINLCQSLLASRLHWPLVLLKGSFTDNKGPGSVAQLTLVLGQMHRATQKAISLMSHRHNDINKQGLVLLQQKEGKTVIAWW